MAEVAAPHRHRALEEVVVRPESELEHPLRLILEPTDLLNGLSGQAALRLLQVDDVVVERELIAAVADGVSGCGCGHDAPWLAVGGSAAAAGPQTLAG